MISAVGKNYVKRTQRGKKPLCTGGFTLLELLAVIAIIAILAGMLLAGAAAARKKAFIAKTEAEVRELSKAWKAYWMTFGEWPSGFATDMDMTGVAMRHLLGDNRLGLVFMDLGEDVYNNGFKDPWGKYYKVDFTDKTTESAEYYETTVFLPQSRRYLYAD